MKDLETGIVYRRELPGIVSELEERGAASYNGYNWREWKALPLQERVDGVAYCRIRRAIESNQQDAVQKYQEMQRRKAESGARRSRA